ncbi:hypothetical protein ACLQ24_04985 [Micromonospora sp. DT4]|uniref:hypothetical protein n=1 Tax=Micromonospora sp. DT4 TaxID=3393438 RepID=UPI003CE92313
MAYRTWGRLLLTALGVSVLAGAGQLGVAYGFGIVRLTGAFTGSTVNQWPAQLVWVGWFAANAAVAGAVLTGRLYRRDTPPANTGRHLAIGGAAALGATAVAPLCMQPARAAELISVDPVWAVGICAILGAVIGAGAAIAVLLRPELGWNMAAVAGTIWLLALVSVLPSLGTTGPLPTVRLGVLEPNWLDDAAAQRLALLLLPMVALLAGAATAGLARWRGQVPLISAATGVAGPVLVAFAYLTAGPGDAVDRYQTTPYYGALIAVLAGALGAAAAALLRWPVGVRAADSEAIAPTDILQPLPAGPTLPGGEPTTSTDPVEDNTDTGRAGGRLVGTGPAPRSGDDTATVRTVPAHWDWPSTTASGQYGPVPADATRPGATLRSVAPGERPDADVPTVDATTQDAFATTQDAFATSGRHDRTPTRTSWLTDPTGEFIAGRQPSSRDADTTMGAVDPTRIGPASATRATAAVSPTPGAGSDRPSGGDTASRDEPGSDPTTTSAPAAPLATGSTDAPAPGSTDTSASGDRGSPAADTTSTPVTGATVTPVVTSAGSTGEAEVDGAGTPSAGRAGEAEVDGTGTPSASSAGTPSASSDGTVAASAPKPRRSRKAKSAPTATSADATTDGTAAAPDTATDGTAATPDATTDGTAATGGTTGPAGGRARRATRVGKGTDVTSADTAQPAEQDSSRPEKKAARTEPDEAAPPGGTDPQAQAAGSGEVGRRAEAAEPQDVPVPADDSAPVTASGTGRTERAATEGGTGASLFGGVAAGDMGADRWTPAPPAWTATSSWTAAPADLEPSAADAPVDAGESTDRTPRFRHRAPLPDLSRAPTWDAFNTTRRTRTPDQSTDTPDQSGSFAPPASTTGSASSTPAAARGTTDRLAGTRETPALAGSVVPPSAAPVVPEQGSTSTTAGSAEPGDDAERTSTDDVRQSSRRGRLGGLFRRNRVRADEESRPAPDAAEPLPAQDEEFVDWVAGLSKPVTDNEPEQESGRRSLRSTGRHHRD